VLEAIGVSDVKMEEGSMRVDATCRFVSSAHRRWAPVEVKT